MATKKDVFKVDLKKEILCCEEDVHVVCECLDCNKKILKTKRGVTLFWYLSMLISFLFCLIYFSKLNVNLVGAISFLVLTALCYHGYYDAYNEYDSLKNKKTKNI